MGSCSSCGLVALLAIAAALPGQESKSRATERVLNSHDRSPFFVVPPRAADAKKHALLVVMPGGPGTRDFLPWVENGILGAAPDDCVGVMVTAVRWQEDQQIVWPGAKSRVPGMRYTTEAYVHAVVKDVRKTVDVDPDRIALLAWSSSGPVAYELLTDRRSPFRRGYVAMSVWRPMRPADLRPAKGRRFVLDQSPDDTTTTFANARSAYEALRDAGAIVRLSTYAGGHGWQDAPIPRLRRNLAWLFGDEPAPDPDWPEGEGPVAKDGNLVRNGGFEAGARGWRTIGNSGRLKVEVDEDQKTGGGRSLHLSKDGGMPLDLVAQEIDLPAGEKVSFSIQCRSEAVKNAWIKLWLYDEAGKVTNEDPDVARVTGTAGWRRHTASFATNGSRRAVIQIVMVLGGELWIDDAVLTVGEADK